MNIIIEIVGISIILMILVGIGVAINSKINTAHSRRHAAVAYVVVITIHATISVWNGFYGPIYGATNDALEFHRAALLYYDENTSADLLIPGWVYSIFLALAYELTHQSWAIGCLLSTLFFGLLCAASVSLYNSLLPHENLNFDKSNLTPAITILLIGLIPSSIILTSITMREVYQMLILCATVLYSIKYIKSKNYKHLFLMLVMLLLFASFHHSFKYYSITYLVVFFCFKFKHHLHIQKSFLLLGGIVGLLIFIFIVDINPLHAAISKFIDGTTQADSESARAYYGLPDVSSNIFSILNFIAVSFFNYMTRPFLWEITSILDMAAIFENIIRLFFIWRILVLRGYLSASIIWVLFAAFLLELLWGMGTLNWGTAQRHHLVAWPLFVVSYFAVLSRYKASQASATTSNLSPKLIR